MQAVDFVAEGLSQGGSVSRIARELVGACLDPKQYAGASTDNITCMLVLFKGPACSG